MTTRDERIALALTAAADALTDAHYWVEGENLPGSEVLAEIVVRAVADILCPPDHLHYSVEFEAHPPDGDRLEP